MEDRVSKADHSLWTRAERQAIVDHGAFALRQFQEREHLYHECVPITVEPTRQDQLRLPQFSLIDW